jgi:hypothetical protein
MFRHLAFTCQLALLLCVLIARQSRQLGGGVADLRALSDGGVQVWGMTLPRLSRPAAGQPLPCRAPASCPKPKLDEDEIRSARTVGGYSVGDLCRAIAGPQHCSESVAITTLFRITAGIHSARSIERQVQTLLFIIN